MDNFQVAKILNNIADLLEIKGIPFKPAAYRNAARSIENLDEDLLEMYKQQKLREIPGVGQHIAEKVIELILTGKLKYYQKLKKEVKVDIENLRKISSLGPKKIMVLYKKLGVKNVKDLEKAIKQGKVQKLVGFGEKTAQNFLAGISLLKTKRRYSYIEAKPIALELVKWMKKAPYLEAIEVAGSFRRKKATIGDLDLLVVSKVPSEISDHFIKFKRVKMVLAKGRTKSAVILDNGLQVDLRVVKKQEFGAALLYFTGSKEHNIALRKIALKQGLTLNEYGLFTLTEKKWVAGKTEKNIYLKLGLKYIPPERRLNKGELKEFKN